MKLLKVKVLNADMKSPFMDFPFEIGKKYICKDFDNSNKECSRGFYATDIEGLTYSYRPTRRVFEVEVGGRMKVFDIYKQRYETMKLVRELSLDEVRELAIAHEPKCGYKLSEALFPLNPLMIERGDVTEHEKELLKEWASVRASVRDSVWASVWASVRDSVWASVYDSVYDSVWASVYDSVYDSVWASVRDSVWDSGWASVEHSLRDSTWAYIGSLFTNAKKSVLVSASNSPSIVWGYIEHQEGIYPFQSAVDLWRAGLLPSFDGKISRLHAGKEAKVVYKQRTK